MVLDHETKKMVDHKMNDLGVGAPIDEDIDEKDCFIDDVVFVWVAVFVGFEVFLEFLENGFEELFKVGPKITVIALADYF